MFELDGYVYDDAMRARDRKKEIEDRLKKGKLKTVIHYVLTIFFSIITSVLITLAIIGRIL